MKISSLFIRSTLFCLTFSVLSTPAFAQSFKATKSSTIKNKDTPASIYQLDINAINAYAKNKQDVFPFLLEFSDSVRWAMELQKYDLRGAGYQLVTSDGIVHTAASSPVITYKGSLVDQPGSFVRMTIADGYFRALVQESTGMPYYVEMVDGPTTNATITLSKANDEAYGICGLTQNHSKHGLKQVPNQSPMKYQVQAPYETEIAFAVDRLAYAQYDTLEDLEQELLTTLNYTDAYYEIHQLTYRLTETYVATDLDSQPWAENSDSEIMLDQFTTWADSDGALLHHDVATLWTGLSFGSLIGIAWVNVIGKSHRQNLVTLIQGRERRNSNIHAHELAHNWGSGHIGNSGWMMSAFLSNIDQENEWHNNTVDAFPGYVESALLYLDDLGGQNSQLPVGVGEIVVEDEINGNGLLDPGESANLMLPIENLDNADMQNIVITIINDNNRAKTHVTLNNDEVILDYLTSNASANVSFNVTLSADAPFDKTLRFLFQLSDGNRTLESSATIDSGTDLLPVDLVSFDAINTSGDIRLEWQTASELNNAGFEIEHQFNGAAFASIDFVDGAGTTITTQNYSYILKNPEPGNYSFRLKQIDFDGSFEYSENISLTLLPQSYRLEQNYPNPFNPQTRIAFQLPVARDVSLEIFDMLGRRIAVLLEANLEAGQHTVMFDGSDLPNGTYLYRLKAGPFEEMKTMILMK